MLFDCLKSLGEAADNGVGSCGQKIALCTPPFEHRLSTAAYVNCYRGGQQTGILRQRRTNQGYSRIGKKIIHRRKKSPGITLNDEIGSVRSGFSTSRRADGTAVFRSSEDRKHQGSTKQTGNDGNGEAWFGGESRVLEGNRAASRKAGTGYGTGARGFQTF